MKIIFVAMVLVLGLVGSLSRAAEEESESSSSSNGANVKIQIPRLVELQGKGMINDLKARRNMTFRKETKLTTESKSKMRIFIDPTTTMILGEETEVVVAPLGVDEKEIKEISLLKGTLRMISSTRKDETVVKTPITTIELTQDDFLLSYDTHLGVAGVIVFSGSLWFKGLEHEDSVELHRGGRAEFKAELDHGEPVFDVLIKGRKLVRGALNKQSALSEKDLAKKEVESNLKEMKGQRAEKDMDEDEKKLAKALCKKPLGNLNECSWSCEGKLKAGVCQKCVRRRCLANAEWGDAFDLSPSESRCVSGKALVSRCDY